MTSFKKTHLFGTAYYKDKECTIRHRINDPALEYNNGNKHWYLNHLRHRSNGPAKIDRIKGPDNIYYDFLYKSWYLYNKWCHKPKYFSITL